MAIARPSSILGRPVASAEPTPAGGDETSWEELKTASADATSGPASGAGKVTVTDEDSTGTSITTDPVWGYDPLSCTTWYWKLNHPDGTQAQFGDLWTVQTMLTVSSWVPDSGTDPRQGFIPFVCSVAPVATLATDGINMGIGFIRRTNEYWSARYATNGSGSAQVSTRDHGVTFATPFQVQTTWAPFQDTKRFFGCSSAILDSTGTPINTGDSSTGYSGFEFLDRKDAWSLGEMGAAPAYLGLMYVGWNSSASNAITGKFRLHVSVGPSLSWTPAT